MAVIVPAEGFSVDHDPTQGGTGGFKLVNDEASPGNNKVYGTDGAGAKGWKDDPSGGALADGDKGDITVSASGATWTIDALSVDAGKLAANAVTTAKILDLNVTEGKLAAGAVTTAKIGDDQVTAAKLADTAVTPDSYTNANITVDAQGRITAASNGSAAAKAYDSLVDGAVTAEVTRSGGTATTITNPGAGTYDLDIKAGADIERVTVFANNADLTGALEFVLTIDNSANSRDRRFIVQLYDANTGDLINEVAAAMSWRQTVAANVTTILINSADAPGATGFYIELR